MDGWAASDLDVGAIVALSPGDSRRAQGDQRGWGPGKYDPRITGTGRTRLS